MISNGRAISPIRFPLSSPRRNLAVGRPPSDCTGQLHNSEFTRDMPGCRHPAGGREKPGPRGLPGPPAVPDTERDPPVRVLCEPGEMRYTRTYHCPREHDVATR